MALRIAVFAGNYSENLALALKSRGHDVVVWVGTTKMRWFTWGPPRMWPLLTRIVASSWIQVLRALLKRQPKWWRAGREPHGTKVLRRLGIDRVAVANVNAPYAVKWLASLNLDLIVVAGFDQILKPAVFNLPRFGAINSHPSPLPRYAGPAPVFWMIRNGERQSAITIHKITAAVDGGNIIVREPFAIEEDFTSGDVEARIREIEPDAIAKAVDQIERGQARYEAQAKEERSYHPYPSDKDKTVRWSEAAVNILCLLRALQPEEAVLTSMDGDEFAISDVRVVKLAPENLVPGEIVNDDGVRIVIGTGLGGLSVNRDQILPRGHSVSGRQPLDLIRVGARFSTISDDKDDLGHG